MKRWLPLLLCLLVAPNAVALAAMNAERATLANGMVLVTSEQPTLPIVSIRLLIRAGSRYDPEGRHGVANLTSRLLTLGTPGRDAMDISGVIEGMGAHFWADAYREQASLNLNILKKDLDVGLALMAEVLTSPSFPREELERTRQSLMAAIRARKDRPGAVAREAFRAALYPDSFYGRPVEGTEDSVRGLDRDAVVDFHRRYYRPDRAILVAVGDITHEEIRRKLTEALAGWNPVSGDPDPPVKLKPPKRAPVRVDRNLTQSNIIMGHEGPLRMNPDHYAVRVMSHILGGGDLTSRLGDNIRNQRGLAYSVYSYFVAGTNTGRFQLAMQTRNESAREAIDVARAEIERMRRDGVTEEELQDAKNYLTGSFALGLDTNDDIADFLGQVEYLGLGLDYADRYAGLIRDVTAEDIRRVARKYLQPDKLIVVVVGNLEKARLEN
jgi:zinc protease